MPKERTLIEDLPVIRPHPLSYAISALIAAPAATANAQEQAPQQAQVLRAGRLNPSTW